VIGMGREWATRKERERFTKKVLAIVGPIAALALGAASIVAIIFLVRRETDAAFRKDLKWYLEPPKRGQPSSWSVSGKMVVVDVKQRAVDPLHFKLPKELRAYSPDDVGSIVQLHWERVQMGHYVTRLNGVEVPVNAAYRWDCRAEVYDKASGALLTTKHFSGRDPPEMKHNDQVEGLRPDDEIIEYLRGLPGRDLRTAK
jgi:hypothetical protein